MESSLSMSIGFSMNGAVTPLRLRPGRHEHHLRAVAHRARRGQQIEAVDARHIDIGDEDVRVKVVRCGIWPRGRFGAGDVVALVAQKLAERRAGVGLVVDNEDPRSHARR